MEETTSGDMLQTVLDGIDDNKENKSIKMLGKIMIMSDGYNRDAHKSLNKKVCNIETQVTELNGSQKKNTEYIKKQKELRAKNKESWRKARFTIAVTLIISAITGSIAVIMRYAEQFYELVNK